MSSLGTIRKLNPQNVTAYEKGRIVQVILAACRGDLQLAALTGGRTALEPALVHFQVELCLAHGELYVSGQGNNIDGVALTYAPGQDFLETQGHPFILFAISIPKPAFVLSIYSADTCISPSLDYVSKLSPEMQQWWTSHYLPKLTELRKIAFGSQEGCRAAWYIRTIVVHPERQRRGIARQLLEAVLQKADTTSRKTCLEVNSDSMVRIFSKYGFRVRATKNFGSYQGGFIVFLMIKEPQR